MLKDINNGALSDGGPVYWETDLSAAIPEPYNGLTALLFLFIALYWLWRVRGEWNKNRVFVGLLLVLAIGGVGGAAFHAFRVSKIFYLMDILPIVITTALASFFLWKRVWKSGVGAFFTVFPIWFLHRWLFSGNFSRQNAIMISYTSTALFILIPLCVVVARDKFRDAPAVLLATSLFGMGMFFRFADRYPISWLPMGTHWLWHVFSGLAVFVLAAFLKGLFASPVKAK